MWWICLVVDSPLGLSCFLFGETSMQKITDYSVTYLLWCPANYGRILLYTTTAERSQYCTAGVYGKHTYLSVSSTEDIKMIVTQPCNTNIRPHEG